MKNTTSDLEGALIIISCDTVDIDDDSIKYEVALPHTIRDGMFISFDLNGEDDVDKDFVMEDFEERELWPLDLSDFDSIEDVAKHILKKDGVELIRALYFDEELVVDNKLTVTFYDDDRQEILSYSSVIENVRIAARQNVEEVDDDDEEGYDEDEDDEYDDEDQGVDSKALLKSLEVKWKVERDKFVYDRRIVLLHIALLIVSTALVWVIGFLGGWTTLGLWVVPIVSGLYFTQWWWCNAYREPLGCLAFNAKRRAKGRPWVNGGFITGVVVIAINYIYHLINPENGMGFSYCYILGFMVGIIVTVFWWFILAGSRWIDEKLFRRTTMGRLDEFSKHIEKTSLRRGRRMFWREFFSSMWPW